MPGAGSVLETEPPGERTLRHIRSILYSLVLAPAAWVLTAVGLTGDLTARGRDGFAVENFTGLLLLLLAGAAYGILVLGPFSPAGPLLAGLVYLAISAWALTSPAAYADVWPPAVAKDGFDLSRPGYGLAAILAVPLICTALSARRWAKYEPPVLPLIGQIGRARGAAPAQGTPLAIERTTVISAGLSILDPEPTTLLHLPSADPTTALRQPSGDSVPHQPSGDTTVLSPSSGDTTVVRLPSGDTTVVRPPSGDSTTAVIPAAAGAGLDDDPTIAWAVPAALAAAVAAADEDTVASPGTPPPADEPATVIDVSAGEPTELVTTEEPTDDVLGLQDAVNDEDPTEAVAEEPAEAVADEEPTEAVVDAELVEDDVTESDDAEPSGAVDDVVPPEVADDDEATVADVVVDEPADEDEETGAAPVAGAERTEVIRLPVADNGEKTQVVRLPVADNGEKTQVVRLPVAGVVPFPAVDPEEKTQVIRLSQVLPFPVRSPEAEPGQRTRDLSNRATGDIGGDETQVIRLAGKTIDDEKTQVIRPALVTRPDDSGEVLAFRAPKLRDATPASTPDADPSAPTPNAEPGPTAGADAPNSIPDALKPTADADVLKLTDDAEAPKSAANVKAPMSIADAEAPNFADDPTSPISLLSANGDEAAEAHRRSMTVMKMERPPDDSDEETTLLEIPAQRRPGTEE